MSTTVYMVQEKSTAGKLKAPLNVEAIKDGRFKKNRLVIVNRSNGHKYLVDSSTNISILPRLKPQTWIKPTEVKLYAANETSIHTYGNEIVTLNLGLRRRFVWYFVVADVSQTIIDADFLQHYKLLVDIAYNTLLDSNSVYRDLLKEYIEITMTAPRKEGIHQIQHHITTRETPMSERARRLPPAKYKAAKEAFD
ncbi:PREDICTED: uncharacterized protein LOC106747853 [Dinoponera quadriceps]|uniref:Uncharacterized protein LOC106747853 n=1 Tax=Dinoponera quadriceps TaxID=609295 RepID=A0A6P3XTR1_DINQU|nr:PREDICTED: uncharacterized protein LOC106747853 [Dinoponera quadriceps]